jgi:uncharacterized protein YceH (UPF0502 family)
VLLLRGAQTPGELKQRTERMHALADLAAVHDTLGQLIERELVRRLDRRPGQKEESYEQLLGREQGEEAGTGDPEQALPASGATENPRTQGTELQQLRERVERLEREVAELRFAMRNPSPSPLPGPAHDPPRFDPRL